MVKLLKPRLKPMKPRLGAAPGDKREQARQRDQLSPWRAWYKTTRWQHLRWEVLVRDLFTCQICKKIEADTSKLVADHKIKHNGDPAMFWNAGNLQCLCDRCHNSIKQSLERHDHGFGII